MPRPLPVNGRPADWRRLTDGSSIVVPDPPRGVCPVCGASVGTFTWPDGPQKGSQALMAHPIDPLACDGETWRESCPGSAYPAGIGPPERAA